MGKTTLTVADKEGLSEEEIAAIESEEGDELDDLKTPEELEAELKAEQAEAKAKAEADAKAKEEADAKEAEEAKLKAEQEALGKTPEELEAAEAKAKEEADAKAAAEAKTPEELKAEEDAKAEADAEAAAKAEADAEADKEPPPFVPQVKIVDDAEFEKLKTTFEEAKKKFDDGDIDYAELDVAKDAFNQAKWEKEYSEKSNASMVQAHWQWEQSSFLSAKENVNFRDNETLNAAYVAAVNKLIGSDEGKTMTDRQVLEAARDKVEKDLGLVRPKVDPEETEDEKKEREKQEAIAKAKKTVGDRSKIDPDLTDLPSAEDNVEENEFTWLDKLEGEAYEMAVGKLTSQQLERYENAQ
jgi:hypothetical protein